MVVVKKLNTHLKVVKKCYHKIVHKCPSYRKRISEEVISRFTTGEYTYDTIKKCVVRKFYSKPPIDKKIPLHIPEGQLCDFGCGQNAKAYSSNTRKWRCHELWSMCPALKRKNTLGLQESYKSGKLKNRRSAIKQYNLFQNRDSIEYLHWRTKITKELFINGSHQDHQRVLNFLLNHLNWEHASVILRGVNKKFF